MKALLKEYFGIRGVKKYTGYAMLCMLIYWIFNARITIWISIIVNDVESPDMMKYLYLLMIGLLANTIISYIQKRVLKLVAHTAYYDLNTRVATKILYSDYDAFTKKGEAYMQTIVNSIVDVAEGGKCCIDLFNDAANFIIITVSICLIEPNLMIPIIILYSIGVVFIKKLWDIITKLDDQCREQKTIRNNEVQKIISGFAEVRSNGTETYHLERIKQMNKKSFDLLMTKANKNAFMNMLFEFIDTAITIAVVMYAIIAIPKGLAPSIAMSLVIYAWRILNPLIGLVFTIDEMSVRKAEFKKYKEFMDSKIEIVDGNVTLSEFQSSIQFKNVSFKYEKSDTVLNHLSFIIRKGEKIGICGHSGGGKSTLIKLIPRFYDVTEGEILIDGINIRELTLKSLRKKIGVVHQSNYIFKGTIMDNVTYGVSNVTESEVINACKQANIYDFIQSLPEGFNTDVGPNGLKLSGGQQQRISLARIFLNHPDIILLDEATSALDNESEAIIQDSLKMFKDKTIITVAHRLSTIQDSDRIFVVDEHSIVEQGTHQELLEKHGMYYNLYTAKI